MANPNNARYLSPAHRSHTALPSRRHESAVLCLGATVVRPVAVVDRFAAGAEPWIRGRTPERVHRGAILLRKVAQLGFDPLYRRQATQLPAMDGGCMR